MTLPKRSLRARRFIQRVRMAKFLSRRFGWEAQRQESPSPEVRYELVTLPYCGVFEHLEYSVNGTTVTLTGKVARLNLKSDGENVKLSRVWKGSTAELAWTTLRP